MNKVYIGIDPSITSTAVCIKFIDEIVNLNYCTKPGKWHKLVASTTEVKEIKYEDHGDYSKSEVLKIDQYWSITHSIISEIRDIVGFLGQKENTVLTSDDIHIAIESYSHSSAAGPLIDLVTFGSCLRVHLRNWKVENIKIVPPMSLKVFACDVTYGEQWVQPKTKKIKRNDEGTAGGSFKKREMVKAALDLGDRCPVIRELSEEHITQILTNASVPKPIDDLIDAWWLMKYIENQ